jgi:prepilin-type processing-associated H-X9-DG protein
MNAFMGEECGCMEAGFNHRYRFYSKTTDIREPSPSDALVFVDEFEDSITTGVFLAFLPGCNDCAFWEGIPGSRHSRACVFSFADGHVGLKKWLDPRTVKTPQRVINKEEYGADNPDFAWVRAHCTANGAQ